MEQHDKLIDGDFALNLQLLQSYPHVDIIQLLSKAMSLRSSDRMKSLGAGAVSEKSTSDKGLAAYGLGWVEEAFGGDDEPDEGDDNNESTSYLRRHRLHKALGIVGSISNSAGSSVSSFFTNAEAGVRKLFSEKQNSQSHGPIWQSIFTGSTTTSRSSSDQSAESESK
jgi:hypothetical protein